MALARLSESRRTDAFPVAVWELGHYCPDQRRPQILAARGARSAGASSPPWASRDRLYGSPVRMAAEHARKPTGLPTKPGTNACSPSKGRPSHRQRSVTLGYTYLEVKCLALQLLGCETHQTVALDVVRRPETTPIHELERYMRCKDCSAIRTSAAIWWRCGGRRFRRVIHYHHQRSRHPRSLPRSQP